MKLVASIKPFEDRNFKKRLTHKTVGRSDANKKELKKLNEWVDYKVEENKVKKAKEKRGRSSKSKRGKKVDKQEDNIPKKPPKPTPPKEDSFLRDFDPSLLDFSQQID
jgi:hypothetical protein